MRTFLPENKQYKYVLTAVDHFSKYKWAYLLKEKSASIVAKKLENFFDSRATFIIAF